MLRTEAPEAGADFADHDLGLFEGCEVSALVGLAVTMFPRDIPRLPRSWIEDTYTNLIHYG